MEGRLITCGVAEPAGLEMISAIGAGLIVTRAAPYWPATLLELHGCDNCCHCVTVCELLEANNLTTFSFRLSSCHRVGQEPIRRKHERQK